MTEGMYGPTWRIDGPPPLPRAHTLINSARVVADVDAEQIERWQNGVSVYSYSPDLAHVWEGCATGTFREKAEGGAIPLPEFGAMCVYFAETCSALGIAGAGLSLDQVQERFVARARAALEAVESAAIEAEFMDGAVLGNNPHLADGEGAFPNGSTAVGYVDALAILEDYIASESGRGGMIHMSPGGAIEASSHSLLFEGKDGILRTINGTIVVPGAGYVGHSNPDGGHTAAGTGQEWIYATGPVEIRRSDAIQLPGTFAEAHDRETNSVTYRVERYYVVTWDTAVQAAVRADRSVSGA